MEETLNTPAAAQGMLMDGFPRTLAQTIAFDEMLAKRNLSVTICLELIVDERELVERICGRRIHAASGRSYHIKFNPPKVPG
mmetsp:Transcript_22212/g.10644  ORF Transcript_22212/g.10644 Transcript_22212/m.10644 type:complete len:82 (+) Transcript_22212:375-620(+)